MRYVCVQKDWRGRTKYWTYDTKNKGFVKQSSRDTHHEAVNIVKMYNENFQDNDVELREDF